MRNPLDPVVLGPVLVGDAEVLLRPGRPSDAAEWRRIRLRDEALIAPYWVIDGVDWASQHTEAIWLRKLVDDRDQARAGTAVHLVVDVDGRFAGQVDLTGIDVRRHAAEIGIWLDSSLSGLRMGALVGAMAVDHAFEVVGNRRVTAPIGVDNLPARAAAERWGMTREARMISYLEVGGTRRDHDLWSILRDDHPTAAVSRVLGTTDPRSTGLHVAIARQGSDRVLPSTVAGVVVLARQRLGRLRDRVTGARGSTSTASTSGVVALDVVNEAQRSASIHVATPHDDAGHLASAVTSLVADALGPEGLCRVSATCDVGDEVLAGAFASAGMRREGVLRDHLDLDGRDGDHELWAATSPGRGRSIPDCVP